jgi:hypothetical protein
MGTPFYAYKPLSHRSQSRLLAELLYVKMDDFTK